MSKRTVHFSFRCQACQEDDLRVARLKGVEGLGRPFEFVLDLAGKAVDAEKMLDAPATLTLHSGQQSQPYQGHLTWFMEAGQARGLHRYRALLVPDVTRLEHNTTNAVYVHKTVPEILEDLLSRAHLQPGKDFEFKLKANYAQRELTCRYQESELQFLHRLTQRNGISYYFQPPENDGENQMLLFVDSPEAHEPPSSDDTLTFLESSGLEHEEKTNALHSFALDLRQSVHRVAVDDYTPERPDLALHAEEQAGQAPGEERLYGGLAATPDEAQATAKLRKQILACRAKTFTGELDAPLARSGFCVKLEQHPLDSFNAKYLVTHVRHEGVQPLGSGHGSSAKVSYTATFSAIPAATPFKPEWTALWPRVSGVLSATVSAEGSGEYAEVDEQGRYQIILPFGQQPGETPKSAKIRMLQPYGGGEHGLHFPLHKGTEVLLTFLQGDPDHPVICGAVPNINAPSMVTGPEHTCHVLKTSSGNVFKADDDSANNYLQLSSETAGTTMSLGTLPDDVHQAHLRRFNNMANQALKTSGGNGNGNEAGDGDGKEGAFQK